MPQIIIEYPEDRIDTADATALVERVHRAVMDSGLFEISHIKTRAHGFSVYRQGEGQQAFIHVQARIKPGRTTEAKAALSQAILQSAITAEMASFILTCEVIDMDADSYTKISPTTN